MFSSKQKVEDVIDLFIAYGSMYGLAVTSKTSSHDFADCVSEIARHGGDLVKILEFEENNNKH